MDATFNSMPSTEALFSLVILRLKYRRYTYSCPERTQRMLREYETWREIEGHAPETTFTGDFMKFSRLVLRPRGRVKSQR